MQMLKFLFDKGMVIGAVILLGIFILASVGLAGTTLAKPLEWLESWLKLFQTIVSIMVGLKIAWHIKPIADALAARIASSEPGKHV